MSITVDDLVASLSSNGIGQEAQDIAAFKAQMAQSLFIHTQSHTGSQTIPRRNSLAQPCNTPTARTPSSSSFYPQAPAPDLPRRRSSSAARTKDTHYASDEDMDMDDERSVEDMLATPSPTHATPHRGLPSPPFSPPQKHRQLVYPTAPTHEPPPSIFTSTDPFYIAAAQTQAQASARSFAPSPFFAPPPPNSPFYLPTQAQSIHSHAHPIEMDTRPILFAGGD